MAHKKERPQKFQPGANDQKVDLSKRLWPLLPKLIAWQITERDKVPATSDAELRHGINYSIILLSACYAEGCLEAGLTAIVDASKLSSGDLAARLVDDLRSRVRTAIGLDYTGNLFAVLVGERLPTLAGKTWEATTVLFQFRNVLAHARMMTASIYTPTLVGGVFAGEEFSGGYEKVEEFLNSKGMMHGDFIHDGAEEEMFSDATANFFWKLAQDFIATVGDNLAARGHAEFKAATRT